MSELSLLKFADEKNLLGKSMCRPLEIVGGFRVIRGGRPRGPHMSLMAHLGLTKSIFIAPIALS